MKKRLLLLVLLLPFSQIYSIEKYSTRQNFTTSMVIPCHDAHAKFLPRLLKSIENYSILPDEVVISLSGTKNLSEDFIAQLENHKWQFPLVLLKNESTLTEGQNRNRACRQAKMEIIISHDADDLSHPNRLEIIKYFFETYKVDHLMHGLTTIKISQPEKIWTLPPARNIQFISNTGSIRFGDLGITIGNGPNAFKKVLFKKIQYLETDTGGGCDVVFNNRAIKKASASIILLNKNFYIYNIFASAYSHIRQLECGLSLK